MSTSTPAEEQLAQPPRDTAGRSGPSRRRLLTGAGLFGAGAVAGGLTGYFTASPDEQAAAAGVGTQTVPFYGPHQAGIVTPAQDRLAFGSLNLTPGAAAIVQSRSRSRTSIRVAPGVTFSEPNASRTWAGVTMPAWCGS